MTHIQFGYHQYVGGENMYLYIFIYNVLSIYIFKYNIPHIIIKYTTEIFFIYEYMKTRVDEA